MKSRETDWTWLDGWRSTRDGWMLDGFAREGSVWAARTLPPSCLMQRRRLFEPSAAPFARLPSNSVNLKIPDLSRLSPLLQPGKLIGSLVPPARRTRHAIYVTMHQGRQVYLPAALLLPLLWMWTARALDALLTPNSLAMYLSRSEREDGLHVHASGRLAHVGTSDTSLRRLSWLAQSGDAQASWASVLTFAHSGELRLRLPSAALDVWAWGVELPTGLLVAELSPAPVEFDLPRSKCHVVVGSVTRLCPVPPQRPTGFATF